MDIINKLEELFLELKESNNKSRYINIIDDIEQVITSATSKEKIIITKFLNQIINENPEDAWMYESFYQGLINDVNN